MKISLKLSGRLAALLAGVGLLSSAASASAQSAFPSPVGTWDVQVSGVQGQGLAYITFNEDFTFSGYELLTVKKFSDDPDGRGTISDERNSSLTVTNISGTNSLVFTNTPRPNAQQLMGFGPISGPWNYDADGKVFGYYTQEVEEQGEGTNVTVYVNPVSFKAKVVPGQRITMQASTPDGKMTYRGLPAVMEMPDFTGDWYGEQKKNGTLENEFFQLSPYTEVWWYNLTGTGPGRTFDGVCLVSQRKYIGLYFRETGGNNRAVYGTYNSKKMSIKTKGTDSSFTPINYNGAKVPDSGMVY
jgi:hypothetical protein